MARIADLLRKKSLDVLDSLDGKNTMPSCDLLSVVRYLNFIYHLQMCVTLPCERSDHEN
jgi:hypothetical protein